MTEVSTEIARPDGDGLAVTSPYGDPRPITALLKPAAPTPGQYLLTLKNTQGSWRVDEGKRVWLQTSGLCSARYATSVFGTKSLPEVRQDPGGSSAFRSVRITFNHDDDAARGRRY